MQVFDFATCLDLFMTATLAYTSKSLSLSLIVQLWVFVFVLIYCWRKRLWWWLSKTLFCEDNKMLLGVILILCYFTATAAFCFSLDLLFIWHQLLTHLSRAVYWFHLMEFALNPARYWEVCVTCCDPLLHWHTLQRSHHRLSLVGDL